MELAATFFYITVSIVAWVIGAFVIILLVMLIKTLKIVQETAKQIKSSVTDFDMIKKAIGSGITQFIENIIGKKLLKGGGKRE